MFQNELAEQLKNLSLPWSFSAKHGAPQGSPEIRWMRIGSFSEARLQLGLSAGGEWLAIASGSAAEFHRGEPFFLPILEEPLHKVRSVLEEGLENVGLSKIIGDSFPFEDIAILGLESHSEHWIHLALEWSSELPVSSALLEALTVAASSAPTQEQRHRAQRLASKLKRQSFE